MRLEAIVPKTKLLKADVRPALQQAISETRKPVEADLQAVTRTWKTKVKWKTRIDIRNGNLALEVTTTNKIYGFVDQGTKPHTIRPKNSPRLLFQTGYVAKTQPGLLSSGSGGASGSWAAAKVVQHPGTEPRRFSEEIAKKHLPTLQRNVERAIKRIVGR